MGPLHVFILAAALLAVSGNQSGHTIRHQKTLVALCWHFDQSADSPSSRRSGVFWSPPGAHKTVALVALLAPVSEDFRKTFRGFYGL